MIGVLAKGESLDKETNTHREKILCTGRERSGRFTQKAEKAKDC